MSAILNGFELLVPEATINTSSSQYGSLAEGSSFSVELGNQTEQEADCDLYLDGVLMGHYRVGAKKKISCQRPTALNRRFTYRAEGSLRSFDNDIPIDPESNGLIKAVFKPKFPSNTTPIPPLLNPVTPDPVIERHPFSKECSAPLSSQCFVTVPAVESGTSRTTLIIRMIPRGPFAQAQAQPQPVPQPVPAVSPVEYTVIEDTVFQVANSLN